MLHRFAEVNQNKEQAYLQDSVSNYFGKVYLRFFLGWPSSVCVSTYARNSSEKNTAGVLRTLQVYNLSETETFFVHP